MSEKTKIALISAIASIIAALIAAGATLWVAERERQDRAVEDAKKAEEELELKQTEAATGNETRVQVTTIRAKVEYNKDGKSRQDPQPPVKADICMLTSVGSYGGATKGCTLNLREDGWVLIANGRKSTSTCTATCFDFPAKE